MTDDVTLRCERTEYCVGQISWMYFLMGFVLLLTDHIFMSIASEGSYVTITDQPNTMILPALSLAVLLAGGMSKNPFTLHQHLFHLVLHSASSASCFATATSLSDTNPEAPRWFHRSVWVELTPPFGLAAAANTMHQVTVWWLAFVFLSMAITSGCFLFVESCANHSEGAVITVTRELRRGWTATILAQLHYCIAGFSAVQILFTLVYDLFFHETPAWQRFDTPLVFSHLSVFFCLASPIHEMFASKSAAVWLVLGVAAAATSTAYVVCEIGWIESFSVWANAASYEALFPPGATASLSFGGRYLYKSATPIQPVFVRAFAMRNTHLQIIRVIIMACDYALLCTHLFHLVYQFLVFPEERMTVYLPIGESIHEVIEVYGTTTAEMMELIRDIPEITHIVIHRPKSWYVGEQFGELDPKIEYAGEYASVKNK